jgi:hypothetical protein
MFELLILKTSIIMKRIILYITILAATISAGAKDISNDTIISLKSPQSVVITEDNTGVKVSVREADKDSTIFNYDYSSDAVIKTTQKRFFYNFSYNYGNDSSNNSHWDITSGGFGLGFVNALNTPAGMNVETGKSFEITILNALAINYRTGRNNDRISLGVGVNWKNYKMGDSQRFMHDEQGVTIGDYPEGAVAKSSRLKVFSVLIPAYYSFGTPTKFLPSLGFSLGAVLNINTHASLNTLYDSADGNKCEEAIGKDLQQRKVTVDAIAMVRLAKWGGLYAKYSPCNTFKKGYGPEFTSLTTGIMLWY